MNLEKSDRRGTPWCNGLGVSLQVIITVVNLILTRCPIWVGLCQTNLTLINIKTLYNREGVERERERHHREEKREKLKEMSWGGTQSERDIMRRVRERVTERRRHTHKPWGGSE